MLLAELLLTQDILIKKGIVQKDDVLRGKGIDPDEQRLEEAISKAREAEVDRILSKQPRDEIADASLEELEKQDDDVFDDRTLEQYRIQRIAELRAEAAAARFGEVYEISKADWVREVTEASNSATVVAHLYEDGIVECSVMETALQAVAAQSPKVKFVKIRSQQAVEKWPEANLPTLFIYRDGKLIKQLVRIDSLGGKQMGAADLEWYLASQGIVDTELEENPARGRGANRINVRRNRETAEDEADY